MRGYFDMNDMQPKLRSEKYMMPLALAFYVSISTEPIHPAEDKFGCGASVVVIGAPSREAVEVWAEDFAKRMILDSQKDQKIQEKWIVELSDRLLSMSGYDQIDWERLNLEAQKSANDPKHRDAMAGSSMMEISHPEKAAIMPEGWDKPERMKELLPKEHADMMNWDESHPGFYIFHDQKKGVVIRAANSFVASIPFTKYKEVCLPQGPQIYIDSFPWIEKYK